MLTLIKSEYDSLCKKNGVDVSHGLEHACFVLQHVQNAMKHSIISLSTERKRSIELAALLHDADDRKYFQTQGYENAKQIMSSCHVPPHIAKDAIQMIELISGSQNGNSIPSECVKHPELLWPRWADRIEAIGTRGVIRCWQYNVEKDRLISAKSTPRPATHEEALSFVQKKRFDQYQRTRKSASMMDHYYDKLLQVISITPEMVQNSYLEHELRNNVEPLLDVCVTYTMYGDEGVVDYIENIKE